MISPFIRTCMTRIYYTAPLTISGGYPGKRISIAIGMRVGVAVPNQAGASLHWLNCGKCGIAASTSISSGWTNLRLESSLWYESCTGSEKCLLIRFVSFLRCFEQRKNTKTARNNRALIFLRFQQVWLVPSGRDRRSCSDCGDSKSEGQCCLDKRCRLFARKARTRLRRCSSCSF